jgi:hypothetical protein
VNCSRCKGTIYAFAWEFQATHLVMDLQVDCCSYRRMGIDTEHPAVKPFPESGHQRLQIEVGPDTPYKLCHGCVTNLLELIGKGISPP